MGKIIAALVVLLAAGGGAGAGFLLRPPPPETDAAEAEPVIAAPIEAVARFRAPFLVPVLRDGRIWSHVSLNLSIYADTVDEETILRREPILRDALMQALFQHGSLGGFDGDFTDQRSMVRLRARLDRVLQDRLQDPGARVLIESMIRQGS